MDKKGAELRCTAPESGQITAIMTLPDVDHSQDVVRIGGELEALREGSQLA